MTGKLDVWHLWSNDFSAIYRSNKATESLFVMNAQRDACKSTNLGKCYRQEKIFHSPLQSAIPSYSYLYFHALYHDIIKYEICLRFPDSDVSALNTLHSSLTYL